MCGMVPVELLRVLKARVAALARGRKSGYCVGLLLTNGVLLNDICVRDGVAHIPTTVGEVTYHMIIGVAV